MQQFTHRQAAERNFREIERVIAMNTPPSFIIIPARSERGIIALMPYLGTNGKAPGWRRTKADREKGYSSRQSQSQRTAEERRKERLT
jgi:hypothetical protein